LVARKVKDSISSSFVVPYWNVADAVWSGNLCAEKITGTGMNCRETFKRARLFVVMSSYITTSAWLHFLISTSCSLNIHQIFTAAHPRNKKGTPDNRRASIKIQAYESGQVPGRQSRSTIQYDAGAMAE
jgi:hypothetical protein